MARGTRGRATARPNRATAPPRRGASGSAPVLRGARRSVPSAAAPGADGWRNLVLVAGGASLLALLVYLRTMAPSVPTGDSGELVVVATVLGIAHPPGYPLFSMVGHLFSFLPLGTPAFRVNLMSGVFHALAVGLVVLSTYRLLRSQADADAPGPPWAALAAAAVGGLGLAFSPAFWRYAVVAEVFALNSFFAALIFFVLLEWERRPERTRLLWTFGLVSGLAATNHQTIVLLAPGILVLLVSGIRKLLDGRAGAPVSPMALAQRLAIGAALLLLGLLVYLYLPIAAAADPPLNWGDPRTAETFWRHLLRADYGTFRLTVSDTGATGSPLAHVGYLLANHFHGFSPPGVALIVAGGWWLWRRRRVAGLAIGLAYLFAGPAFVAYANPFIDNPILFGVLERFYILPSVFVPLVLGAGVYQVALWVATRVTVASFERVVAVVAAALLIIPLSALVVHFNEVDHSDNVLDRNFGEEMLAPIEPGALFITQGDVVTMVVDYLQLAEGYRKDIIAVDIEKLKLATYVRQMRRQHPQLTIPWEFYVPGRDQMAQLVNANLARRPVYMLGAPKDPNFTDTFDFQRAGFSSRLFAKGSGGERYDFVEQKIDFFRKLRYPTRSYPDTTFESTIVKSYGAVAFDVAYVLDDGVRNNEAIPFYRKAIELDDKNGVAYKNLGLLLQTQGESAAVVGPLWEKFLQLVPEDPQAAAVREQLRRMGR